MSKALWRLLFVVGFLPCGVLPVLWMLFVIPAAGLIWMVRGPRTVNSEDRMERWAFGLVGRALFWPLNTLMHKAEVLRDLWTD